MAFNLENLALLCLFIYCCTKANHKYAHAHFLNQAKYCLATIYMHFAQQ